MGLLEKLMSRIPASKAVLPVVNEYSPQGFAVYFTGSSNSFKSRVITAIKKGKS
jgi:hypothetical protein